MVRKITKRDREIWRQNALKGTEKTRGRKRGAVKRKGPKWGFEEFGKGTIDRNKGDTKGFSVQVNGKKFGVRVRRHPRYGKNFFSVLVVRPNSNPTDRNTKFFQVKARSYKDAKEKVAEELKINGGRL